MAKDDNLIGKAADATKSMLNSLVGDRYKPVVDTVVDTAAKVASRGKNPDTIRIPLDNDGNKLAPNPQPKTPNASPKPATPARDATETYRLADEPKNDKTKARPVEGEKASTRPQAKPIVGNDAKAAASRANVIGSYSDINLADIKELQELHQQEKKSFGGHTVQNGEKLSPVQQAFKEALTTAFNDPKTSTKELNRMHKLVDELGDPKVKKAFNEAFKESGKTIDNDGVKKFNPKTGNSMDSKKDREAQRANTDAYHGERQEPDRKKKPLDFSSLDLQSNGNGKTTEVGVGDAQNNGITFSGAAKALKYAAIITAVVATTVALAPVVGPLLPVAGAALAGGASAVGGAISAGAAALGAAGTTAVVATGVAVAAPTAGRAAKGAKDMVVDGVNTVSKAGESVAVTAKKLMDGVSNLVGDASGNNTHARGNTNNGPNKGRG